MTTLSKYLQDTSAMLHDQAYSFTSQDQLTIWINEARRQIAQRTGCIRRLVSGQSGFGASAQPGTIVAGAWQPGAVPGSAPNAQQGATTNTFMTIPGVERYPYQGFVNPYVQQQFKGIKGVIDTIACSVAWGSGVNASPRPSLAWLPWEDFQAYGRAYGSIVQSYPYWWTVYNDGELGEIWMFPVPSFAMEIELDVFCAPADLHNDNDFDALPPGFQNAVKYGAAMMAYQVSRRYGQAAMMEEAFLQRLGNARIASDMGKTSNFYGMGV